MGTTHNPFGLVTMFLVPLWASRTCAVYIPNYILATFCFLFLEIYFVNTNFIHLFILLLSTETQLGSSPQYRANKPTLIACC